MHENEHSKENPNTEPHLIEAEKAVRGYRLGRDETALVDLDVIETATMVHGPAYLTDEMKGPISVPVAEIRVGGPDYGEYATAYVYQESTYSSDRGNKFVVLQNADGTRTGSFAMLDTETPFVIGRSQRNQDNVGDMVSRDHCAVKLDEDGRLLVENHNPANSTRVRRYGRLADDRRS